MLGIYCRISKKKPTDRDVSIESQTQSGINFAKEKGLSCKVFADVGITGTKSEIKARPAFAEMFDAIEKKKITAVYCYDQSRIERNSSVWNLFTHVMIESNCQYYQAGKKFELNDPHNKLFSGIISLTNELYATLTSQKVKSANLINAKKGKTHGLTAYGYERDENGFFKVATTESEIVKRIYKLSLAGNGAYTIANVLNKEGVPTRFNSFHGEIKRKDKLTGRVSEFKKSKVRWRGNVIHDMIRNPIYKGIRKWNDEEINIVPIIDENTWKRVNQNLQNNKKRAGKRAEYRYLLNGLIYCGNCGADYRGKYRLKCNDNAYKCVNKFTHEKCTGSRSISIPKLDTLIYRLMVRDREFNKLLKSLPAKGDSNRDIWKSKLSVLKGELELANKKVDRFYDLLQDPELNDDARLKEDLKTAKKQKVNAEGQIDIVQNKIVELENDEKQRRKLNLSEFKLADPDFNNLRDLIHSLVDSIMVFHNKKERGGEFLVEVRFKAYDGSFYLTSDWKASQWAWIAPKNNKTVTLSDEELIHFN